MLSICFCNLCLLPSTTLGPSCFNGSKWATFISCHRLVDFWGASGPILPISWDARTSNNGALPPWERCNGGSAHPRCWLFVFCTGVPLRISENWMRDPRAPLFHYFLRQGTRTPTIFGANPCKKWPSSAQHHSQVLRFNLITRSASPKARKPELGCGRSIGEKRSGTWFCVVVRQQAGVRLVSLLVCLLLKTGYLFKRVGLFRPFPRNPCFKHVPGWIWGNYREFTG